MDSNPSVGEEVEHKPSVFKRAKAKARKFRDSLGLKSHSHAHDHDHDDVEEEEEDDHEESVDSPSGRDAPGHLTVEEKGFASEQNVNLGKSEVNSSPKPHFDESSNDKNAYPNLPAAPSSQEHGVTPISQPFEKMSISDEPIEKKESTIARDDQFSPTPSVSSYETNTVPEYAQPVSESFKSTATENESFKSTATENESFNSTATENYPQGMNVDEPTTGHPVEDDVASNLSGNTTPYVTSQTDGGENVSSAGMPVASEDKFIAEEPAEELVKPPSTYAGMISSAISSKFGYGGNNNANATTLGSDSAPVHGTVDGAEGAPAAMDSYKDTSEEQIIDEPKTTEMGSFGENDKSIKGYLSDHFSATPTPSVSSHETSTVPEYTQSVSGSFDSTAAEKGSFNSTAAEMNVDEPTAVHPAEDNKASNLYGDNARSVTSQTYGGENVTSAETPVASMNKFNDNEPAEEPEKLPSTYTGMNSSETYGIASGHDYDENKNANVTTVGSDNAYTADLESKVNEGEDTEKYSSGESKYVPEISTLTEKHTPLHGTVDGTEGYAAATHSLKDSEEPTIDESKNAEYDSFGENDKSGHSSGQLSTLNPYSTNTIPEYKESVPESFNSTGAENYSRELNADKPMEVHSAEDDVTSNLYGANAPSVTSQTDGGENVTSAETPIASMNKFNDNEAAEEPAKFPSTYTEMKSSGTSGVPSDLDYDGNKNANATTVGSDNANTAELESHVNKGEDTEKFSSGVYGTVDGAEGAVAARDKDANEELIVDEPKKTETDSLGEKDKSIKGYLSEKLMPGEDDKALSDVISDAFHKRNDDDDSVVEENKPMGKVTESEEVASRLGSSEAERTGEVSGEDSPGPGMMGKFKGAFSNWFAKAPETDSTPADSELSPGKYEEEKTGYQKDKP